MVRFKPAVKSQVERHEYERGNEKSERKVRRFTHELQFSDQSNVHSTVTQIQDVKDVRWNDEKKLKRFKGYDLATNPMFTQQ